jgi:hypothetical protein
MRSSTKNVIATVLVAAIVVPYIGYLVWGEMPFLKDPRGMGATGLILGVAAAVVVGRAVFDPAPLSRAASATGVIALVTGIATVWAETSEGLLAAFIGLIVLTWVLGELAYSGSRADAGRRMAHSG